jgi:hypothetical protein
MRQKCGQKRKGRRFQSCEPAYIWMPGRTKELKEQSDAPASETPPSPPDRAFPPDRDFPPASVEASRNLSRLPRLLSGSASGGAPSCLLLHTLPPAIPLPAALGGLHSDPVGTRPFAPPAGSTPPRHLRFVCVFRAPVASTGASRTVLCSLHISQNSKSSEN